MTGNAIKCDVCYKVDVYKPSEGAQYSTEIKWFRVAAPQLVEPHQNYKFSDICSLKCLQEYSEGWTSN